LLLKPLQGFRGQRGGAPLFDYFREQDALKDYFEKINQLNLEISWFKDKVEEIIQFGSSVYAPEYARDVDLLVITNKKKEYGGYLDSFEDFSFTVDVVVKEVGEVLKSDFAFHVLGAFEVLYGDGRYLIAVMAYLATEDTRWGRTKRRLPKLYRKEFEEFINTLQIEYFYNGNYPENYKDEFEKWQDKVKVFVERLELEGGKR